jgi:hypothetical protein
VRRGNFGEPSVMTIGAGLHLAQTRERDPYLTRARYLVGRSAEGNGGATLHW